jgi:hypothetical protein
MFTFVLYAVGMLGPFAIWAGIYVAANLNIFTSGSMFRALRVWRWITWIAGILLWLSCLPPFRLHWLYGACASMFSIGLSFPDSWLKRRLNAPDEATPTSFPF